MPNGLFGWPGRGIPEAKNVDVQIFTTSGTWVKPAGARWVTVVCVGPGGGGGAGARNTSTTTRFGGTSGGGGFWGMLDLEARALPSTIPVTIGAGGAGAIANSVDTSTGANGSRGGESLFGNYIRGYSGNSGNGGGTTVGGTGTNLTQHSLGAVGTASNGVATLLTPTVTTTNTAGGCGGVGYSSVQGLNVYQRSGNVTSLSLAYWGSWMPSFLSQGGFGGISATTAGENANAGNGINAGGGGGGGAGVNGVVDGGAGGTGGDGIVIVRTFIGKTMPLNVMDFQSSGMWVKPQDSRLTTARIVLFGGGGGGASGARGATGIGQNRSGGGGGSGAAVNIVEIPLSVLPNTVEVAIGQGGVGGAGVSTDSTEGNPGSNGGVTTFGSYVVASGGYGGMRGRLGTGSAVSFIPVGMFNGLVGTQCGAGGSAQAQVGAAALAQIGGMVGGGTGGTGYSSTDVEGSPADTSFNTSYQFTGTVATSTDRNAVDPLAGYISVHGVAGAAGGSQTWGINGGNGVYGSGAGGGAASNNGSISGAGGTGGSGRAIILCF